MTFIVDGLADYNVFFIFRENGTEVKCYFDTNSVIVHDKYVLTSKEVADIKKYYKGYKKQLRVNKLKNKRK